MSGEIEDVPALLHKVDTLGRKLDSAAPQTRKELLAATRKLYLALETPIEAILRMEWAQVIVAPT